LEEWQEVGNQTEDARDKKAGDDSGRAWKAQGLWNPLKLERLDDAKALLWLLSR
jgi:hypothetical protein